MITMELRFFTAKLPVLLILVLPSFDPSFAASINYCHDEKTNQEWENLANNTTEPQVKELYSLRKELCRKVDQGQMELDTAIDIFEAQRLDKIEAIKRRNKPMGDSITPSG